MPLQEVKHVCVTLYSFERPLDREDPGDPRPAVGLIDAVDPSVHPLHPRNPNLMVLFEVLAQERDSCLGFLLPLFLSSLRGWQDLSPLLVSWGDVAGTEAEEVIVRVDVAALP